MFPPLKGTCIGIYDYTTSPYNVTGGANVEIAFVLLQDGSFFYFIWLLMKIFLKNLKEESVVYQKVDTNLNFVDREKQVEKFWKENQYLRKKVWRTVKTILLICSMMDRRQQTENRISVMYWPVLSKIWSRDNRTMKGYMVPRKAGWIPTDFR